MPTAKPPPVQPTFTYVLIPADDGDVMTERTLDVPSKLEDNLSCCTSAFQDYFREYGGAISEEGRDRMIASAKEQISKQGKDAGAVDPKALSQLAMSQTVDIVQLLPATAASGFYGVNMYVDDKGVSKNAPTNRRASEICAQCGMATDIRGDAFVARLWDDQEGFVRLDLRAVDLDSGAPWVVEARERNEKRPDVAQAAKQLGVGVPAPPALLEPEVGFAERLGKAQALRDEGRERLRAAEHEAANVLFHSAVRYFEPPPAYAEPAEEAAARELRLSCLLNRSACAEREPSAHPLASLARPSHDPGPRLVAGACSSWSSGSTRSARATR